ncbi:MAG: tetratricopeptide repeat protein [Pirellulaceae bacterium]
MAEPATGPTPTDEGYEISPAKRKQLQQLYDRAQQLMKQPKYDHDYVHTLLSGACKLDPANVVFADTMMTNLERKFNGKKPSSLFGGFGGGGRAVKKLAAAGKWSETLSQGMDQLLSNPWDTTTLLAMVEACEACRYNEAGLRYMKNATDGSPGDLEVLRTCAGYLGRVGQFDQAIAVWHYIEDKSRGDDEANRMISQLTLDRERQAQGLATVTNRIDPKKTPLRPKPASTTPTEEKPRRQIELNERQRLKNLIEQNQYNLENYLQLADAWCQVQNFNEAENTLKQAHDTIGTSFELTQKREEVQIARARHRLLVAEGQAKEKPSESADRLRESLRDDLNRIELDIYSQRVERRPDDFPLKYELGLRLKRAGNLPEAIQEFDAVAAGDEKLAAAAYLGKGECLQANRRYEPALEAYKEALTRYKTLSSDRVKQLLYRAGVLAAALKQTPLALQYLGQLAKLDPSYKDVGPRLDKLKQMREDG